MTDRELMQMALNALESSRVFVTSREKIKHPEGTEWYDERIEALRAALAQPEQELVAYTGNGTFGREADVQPTGFFFQIPKPEQNPVAWELNEVILNSIRDSSEIVAPPQREWQGLTDDELDEINGSPIQLEHSGLLNFARAIEAKLKEKNT